MELHETGKAIYINQPLFQPKTTVQTYVRFSASKRHKNLDGVQDDTNAGGTALKFQNIESFLLILMLPSLYLESMFFLVQRKCVFSPLITI